MRCATLVATVLCLFARVAPADELFVPSAEYPTIQTAVDAAVDGDEVVLRDGEFTGAGNLDVVMPARAITVRAENNGSAIIVGRGLSYPSDTRAFIFEEPLSAGSVVQGIVMRGCNGQPSGGAMWIKDSSVTISACVFDANQSTDSASLVGSGSGGAVTLSRASAVFQDCVFTGNRAFATVAGGGGDGNGGAVAAYASEVLFERCVFDGNFASGSDLAGIALGGAVYSRSGSIIYRLCTIRENQTFASSAGGAGVSAREGSVLMLDCFISANRAVGAESAFGGGASINADLTMISCKVLSNSASDTQQIDAFGGGLSLGGSTTLINTWIAGNAAFAGGCRHGGSSGGSGGAINLNGTLTVVNCVITGNRADCAQGVRFGFSGGEIQMVNSIVRNGDDRAELLEGDVQAFYSNIQGGFPGEGNIDTDPLLVPGTYRLLPGSPCIDAGSTDLLPADEFDLDGDGDTTEPIPFDADGSSRFVDDPATPDTGVGFPVADMGAFEYQPPCRVDLDGDGALTIFDFLAFFNAFDDADPVADFDGDGAFTVFDFLAFQNEFDAGCE